MACLTSAIEPLRAANEIANQEVFRWRLIAETDAPVRSSSGVMFSPDDCIDTPHTLTHLFLISGPDAKFANPSKGNGVLRWLDRTGVVLGGFSGGIFPLARSGVLTGHSVAAHWCYDEAFKVEFPDIVTTGDVINRDRRRMTVAGGSAVFDLMLGLIEDHLDASIMTEVACWFQHPFVRSPDVQQKRPTIGSDTTEDSLSEPVAQAIKMFAEHIEDPVLISDVATAINVSPRNLERLFKRDTGESPLKYYRTLRLEKARQMVRYSNESIMQIALATGYFSSSSLTRHYRRQFGLAPSEERFDGRNAFRVTDGTSHPPA